ncbi:hypothetical protein [Streptacidiphilus monticola]|uniref:Uncharacterized protein n=1 Tax=Streptacidiphilus monticola TaxID=2161674 RepID=A0ABW1FWK8_9ACTN
MSDAFTDITETRPEDEAAAPHGKHRGHLAEEESPAETHGRHRRSAMD